MEAPEGYDWHFIVLTTKYDPRSAEDVTVEALRSRAMLVRRLAKRAWERRLKAPGAGMSRMVEVSPRGMVHVNLIYYGPEPDEGELEAVLSAYDSRAGSVDCEKIESKGEHLSKGQLVARAAKYAAKGMMKGGAFFDEGWLSGKRTKKPMKMVSPELAARWELAVRGLQLTQRYGVLRGMGPDEDDFSAEPDEDSEVECGECGTVGEWGDSFRGTVRWIYYCHDRRKRALRGSSWHVGKWKPPP